MKTFIKLCVFGILALFLISVLPELLGAAFGILVAMAVVGGVMLLCGAGVFVVPLVLAVGAVGLLAVLGLPLLLAGLVLLLLATPFILFFKVLA